MKTNIVLLVIFILIFIACKKEQECCCVYVQTDFNITILDSLGVVDTAYLNNNNQLHNFNQNDSLITFQFNANLDSTINDAIVKTTRLLHLSATDTDTLETEINGHCGRFISKIWYNGILQPEATAIFVVK
ncbi:MAG: hypothetical protein R2807_08195 [Chitinophagales bacterium]